MGRYPTWEAMLSGRVGAFLPGVPDLAAGVAVYNSFSSYRMHIKRLGCLAIELRPCAPQWPRVVDPPDALPPAPPEQCHPLCDQDHAYVTARARTKTIQIECDLASRMCRKASYW